jgi:hypothetical protein
MRPLLVALIVLLVFGGINIFCQNISFNQIRGIREVDTESNIKGNHIYFDSLLISAALLVSKKYPELKKVNIEFHYKNIKTMMAARPLCGSLLLKKNKRKYEIIVSTNSTNNSDKLFQQLSINSFAGILSHEFAHLLCYNQKSGLQLLYYGIYYFFNKKEVERETDQIAIQRGFGIELLEYDQYIFNSNLVSKKYLKNKIKNYLSINEIEMIIDK